MNMFQYYIKEDESNRVTYVQWFVNHAPLAFKDVSFAWSKYGRQGAYQAAQMRVRELSNAHSRRNASK